MPLMLLLDIGRCDAYSAARRRADLCPQSSFISILPTQAAQPSGFSKVEAPCQTQLDPGEPAFSLFSPFLVISLHCCDLFSGNVSGKRSQGSVVVVKVVLRAGKEESTVPLLLSSFVFPLQTTVQLFHVKFPHLNCVGNVSVDLFKRSTRVYFYCQ